MGWLLCLIVIISVVREREEESPQFIHKRFKMPLLLLFLPPCVLTNADGLVVRVYLLGRESHSLFHVLRMTQNLGGFSSMAAIFL